jgi:hypothetical protein
MNLKQKLPIHECFLSFEAQVQGTLFLHHYVMITFWSDFSLSWYHASDEELCLKEHRIL